MAHSLDCLERGGPWTLSTLPPCPPRFYLLPAKRDVQLTTRLRFARQYPTIYTRTNRYKNSAAVYLYLILFGLNRFQ